MRLARQTMVLALLAILGAASQARAADWIEDAIAQKSALLPQWSGMATRVVAVNVLIVLLGAAVTAAQGFKGAWPQRVAFGLGLIISTVTAVNNIIFPVDCKTLRAAVFDGRQAILEMGKIREAMQGASAEDLKVLRDEFAKQLNRFTEIERKVEVADLGLPGEAIAYAQAAAQFREVKDPTSLYALGEGKGDSLTEAKENARKNAIDRLAEQVRAADPTWATKSPDSCRAAIQAAAEVVNTSLSFDRASKKYQYVMQMRILRTYTQWSVAQDLGTVVRVEGTAGVDVGTRGGTLKVTAQARDPKEGNFTFHFSYSPRTDGKVTLELKELVTVAGGASPASRWSFEVFVNDRSTMKIGEARYDNEALMTHEAQYKARTTVEGAMMTVRVVGFRPRTVRS